MSKEPHLTRVMLPPRIRLFALTDEEPDKAELALFAKQAKEVDIIITTALIPGMLPYARLCLLGSCRSVSVLLRSGLLCSCVCLELALKRGFQDKLPPSLSPRLCLIP